MAAGTFRRGNEKLVVDLEARPTAEAYAIRLYAPGNLHGEIYDAGRFSLGQAKLESDVMVARQSKQAGILIYELGASRTELIDAGANPELTIRQSSNPGELKLVGLDAATALVDACSADLMARWGYSKELQRSVATPAKPLKDWASYVSTYDYPIKAIFARAHGETHALIDVGLDGVGSNCRIVRSSGNELIDKTTCMVVTERARYAPARNFQGEAIKAPVILTFRWELARF